MKKKIILITAVLSLLLSLLLVSCGSKNIDEDQEVAVIVALTQTSIASEAEVAQSEPAAAATEAPAEEPERMDAPTGTISGFVSFTSPPTPAMTVYAVEVETGVYYVAETAQSDGNAPFSMEVTAGNYQLYAYTEIGAYVGHAADGWNLTVVSVAGDQSITDIYLNPPGAADNEAGVTFIVPDSPDGKFYAPEIMPELPEEYQQDARPEPIRISFAPGGTSAHYEFDLESGAFASYVLTVMAGQQLVVDAAPFGEIILDIRGANGEEVIPASMSKSSWGHRTSTTQDYYIEVISQSGMIEHVVLDVSVPVETEPQPELVYPQVEPFDWDDMEQLVLTGVPVILPPVFPAEAGLPEIVPYWITMDAEFYELFLDYGADCHGAGACHYGSMYAETSTGKYPVGTVNSIFDETSAEEVYLERGVTGYFVESNCGASCSDAAIFFIYGDYEYMFGSLAAKDDLIALVNSALLNSIAE